MTEIFAIHFPPEWAEQSAVLLAWPCEDGDFSPWLEQVENTYGLIALDISRRQNLIIACRNRAHRRHIENRLFGLRVNLVNIRLIEIPYNDVWVRDTAPLTVEGPKGTKLLNFRFNGWGSKYAHQADAGFARNLFDAGVFGKTTLETVDFVLEGGSIESDGEGSLLTTTRCLLNPNRNGSLTRAQIEQQLKDSFGISRILWLHHGHAEGDDTDAHVDTLARFCSSDTIAYTSCEDPTDPLYDDLKGMEDELKGFTTLAGQPYRRVPLPIPKPIRSEEGERLPATYANFLIINGAVLVPVYDDPADAVSMERLAGCFPSRMVIGIPCTPLIRQYGSLHCMTMQFPKSLPLS